MTKANNPRATEPTELIKHFDNKDMRITGNVAEAETLACKIAHKGDLVLVTGSLFVVGESRTLFKGAG